MSGKKTKKKQVINTIRCGELQVTMETVQSHVNVNYIYKSLLLHLLHIQCTVYAEKKTQ